MKKLTKIFAILALFAILGGALAACGKKAVDTPEVDKPVAEDTVVEEPVVAPSEKGAPFTIGVSNPFISSEYRTQMIDNLITINEEYKALGLTKDLVIENFDTDVAGQIEQLENLINAGVDAILVNPGDAVALNQILEEAVEMGILVFSIDQEIEAKGVINVGHNQYEWARISAAWLAENLKEGNVVQIEGFIGHPANNLRMAAVADVFADYPGINVLASESGFWDEATGQQVMSDFLAAYPNIDGYWTQDGMAIGALEAIISANPDPLPLGVGEARVKFLQLWAEMLKKDPDYKTIAVANAPGVNATALRIAVEMLLGKELDKSILGGQFGSTVVIDVPIVVTPENFDEVYEEYVASGEYPDSYLLDGIMTRDEVLAAYFGEGEKEEPVVGVPFTIGVSNPFISSEYRTQMIDNLITINEEYKALGLTKDLVIENFDTDVAGQIEQIENLINAGVDAMLVNPGDAVALNQILEEAVEMGILVFSIDQEIEAKGVINVGHNQYEWARISAAWLAENLKEGNVVQIEGFIGHPANNLRMAAVADVFADYPGINVLASESGFWDEATGQQVMSDFLAAYPNIDGYWTQDGMAIGALEAIISANPDPLPLGVGEARVKFLQLWAEMLKKDPDYKTIAVANAPGVNATALRIAVEMLLGKELDKSILGGQFGSTVVIDVPIVVTPENFDEVYEEYVASGKYPDSYLLDGIMTRDEVLKAYFK